LAEVAKGNETVEWACSIPQLSKGGYLEVSGGITCREITEPLGVVASIAPFNFPFMVPMWTIPIALTVGNVVICKVCTLFDSAFCSPYYPYYLLINIWCAQVQSLSVLCRRIQPSEKVPMTLTRTAELLVEAGIPSGVFQVCGVVSV
jgi:acyl-CoA reductase-like NAD-dependent aldehyde dehydrogenase